MMVFRGRRWHCSTAKMADKPPQIKGLGRSRPVVAETHAFPPISENYIVDLNQLLD
jgi:hypothetical protein